MTAATIGPRVAEGAEVVEVPTVARHSSVIQPLALTIIGALPGLALREVIEDRASVAVGAGVALAAGLVALGAAEAARRGRRTAQRGAVTLGVLVVGATLAAFAVAVASPEEGGGSALSAVLDAVVHGWATVVTSPVPSAAEPRLLVPLTLIVWGATAGGVLIATRSAARVAPLLPGATALVLASLASGAHQSSPIVTGLVFVAAAAVVLVGRNPRPTERRPARRRRSAVTATAFTLVTAAAAGLAGPALAAGRDDAPFDPRDHVTPPNVPAAADSPLDLVARRLRRPRDVMFTAVWTGEPQATRLAVLDIFDGANWSVSGSWLRAGAALPDPERGLDRTTVEAEITIDGLAGPWLPSFGDRPELSGIGAIVQPESGALAVTGDDLTGTRYRLTAHVPNFDDAALATATVAVDGESQRALMVPDGVPVELQQLLDAALANVTTSAPPYVLASTLEAYFRANYGIDPESRPGHSYGRLAEAFTRRLVATDEQFATWFAVLGRMVGLPTRVVVGFGPGTETASGTHTVHSGDVEVWAEVRFDGFGWVPFRPAPSDADAGADNGPMELDGQQIQVVVNDPVSASPPPSDVGPSGVAPGDNWFDDHWLALAVIAVAVFAALALISAMVLVILKRRQTARRRRAADPRQRVMGAWHDVLDRLTEHGLERPWNHTVEEHVEQAERVSASLTGLYRPVSRALYGHTSVDDDDAAQAWRCRDRFVRDLRSEDTIRRRCRRAIDVRPLLHRSGTRPVPVTRTRRLDSWSPRPGSSARGAHS